MGEKSYLKEQVYLPGLNSYDLFTDAEYDEYMKIVEAKNELNRMESLEIKDENERRKLVAQKKEAQATLAKLIAQHAGKPRTVRLKNLIYYPKDADYEFPAGVNWENMKFNRKIAEFSCELTRAMGLKHMDYTFDHIVLSWKSLDILEQIVINGFYIPLLHRDGTVENRHYRFYTSSAGQLRRDKIQAISDVMWEKIKTRIECGLNWKEINKRGGVNVNKLMAYTALPGSATTEWTDFDIDRCVVANDFEGEVTDLMMYIKPDYTHSEEICTVKINHTDGCGMILPSEAENNFIFRMSYCKGLMCVFDFMKFCEEKGVEPVITDPWGQKHNLKDERINMIFFVSMTKMWKYYDSWDAYKAAFKRCGCKAGIGNVEEEDIDNASTNYQFIDSLESFTDAEVKAFTKNEHDKIMNISKNKNTMLRTLKADKESDNPYKAALAYYPEFLWDSYTRTQLKDIRKRMLLDAKSGKIKNLNKRLYAVPDLYAVCEWLFCGIEKPEGLLKAGEVAAKTFIKYDKADLLRSPSLYMEHAIRTIVHDPEVYRWFTTNGVYASTHDLVGGQV